MHTPLADLFNKTYIFCVCVITRSGLIKTIIQTHAVHLTFNELADFIPEDLRSRRVADGHYHWQISIGSGAPPASGVDGDLWVDANIRERIYVRRCGRWRLWTLGLVPESALEFHPWLSKRALQLSPHRGTLVWELVGLNPSLQCSWDSRVRACPYDIPKYSKLDMPWLAAFLLASARRVRWVLRFLPHLRDARVSSTPPSSLPVPAASYVKTSVPQLGQ